MPEMMTVLTPAIDDESDNEENLDLDLHVSDSENVDDAVDDTEKVASDIPMDIEDEILNKFDKELENTKKTELITEEIKKNSDENISKDALKIADKDSDEIEENSKREIDEKTSQIGEEANDEEISEEAEDEDVKMQPEVSKGVKLQGEDSKETKLQNEESNEAKLQNEDSNEAKLQNESKQAILQNESKQAKLRNEDSKDRKLQDGDSNGAKLQNDSKSQDEETERPKENSGDSSKPPIEETLRDDLKGDAKSPQNEQNTVDLNLQIEEDSCDAKSPQSEDPKSQNENSDEARSENADEEDKLLNEDSAESESKNVNVDKIAPVGENCSDDKKSNEDKLIEEKTKNDDVILDDEDMELEDMPEKSDSIVTRELKVNVTEENKKEEKLLNGDIKEKEEDDKTTSDISEKDEGEDLLLVMDEKTAEESDFTEDTKEKDPISQEEESNEESTETPPDDEAMDVEETVDDIDIEEHDANGDDTEMNESEISSDNLNITVIEKVKITDEKKDEAVKVEENENETDLKDEKKKDSFLKAILTNVKCADEPTKSVKRQLSDPESGDDLPKKPKLLKEEEEEEIDEKKVETKELIKLGALKQFMLDKSLKGFTRDHLEMLCIQKMCECIVQKSEIGELKLKIRMHEQLIDSLRKETVMLSKQTRDLHIVHTKVAHDLTKIQENSNKPLIVPKITRSVGLQAVVRDELRRRMMKSPVPLKQPPKKIAAIAPATNATQTVTKSPATPITRTYTSPAKPQQGTPVRVVQQIKPKIISTTTNSPAKPGTENKGGVIDLTDEDDKVATTTPVKTANGTVPINGTKVNMINAPNGHKFVVMPNGQTVMVKLSTAPVVVSPQQQSVLRGQSPMNGTARPMNNMIRPVRARTPINNQVRAKAPVAANQQRASTPQQRINMKHPAPLPPPPPAPKHCVSMKPNPPKPQLMLNKTTCGTGIILSWKMPYKLDMFEDIASYQLYAYQETKSTPKTDSWGKIGDVKALELPMAVTLTQFAVGNRYYFAVRAVDVLSRHGPFSEYQTILL